MLPIEGGSCFVAEKEEKKKRLKYLFSIRYFRDGYANKMKRGQLPFVAYFFVCLPIFCACSVVVVTLAIKPCTEGCLPVEYRSMFSHRVIMNRNETISDQKQW